MDFEWDEDNCSHIAYHGVTPDEAAAVLYHDPLEIEVQLRNGEERRLVIGMTDEGRYLSVVYTIREEFIRVVTAFPASAKRRRMYRERKGS